MLPCGGQNTEPIRSFDEDINLVAQNVSSLAHLLPESIQILIEAPHVRRLCNSTKKADELMALLPNNKIGLVLDTSHVYATGGDVSNWAQLNLSRIKHVQFRDALRNGEINLSLGNGEVDFVDLVNVLESNEYDLTYSLELETHDIDENQREKVSQAAGEFSSELITRFSK